MSIFRILRSRGDDGIAMISAILVGAVLVALCASILAVSTSNLVNAGRDRSGVVALATSESGVAQAIEYLTTDGTGAVDCYLSGTCGLSGYPSASSWLPPNGQTVSLSNGRSFQVTITPLVLPNPPSNPAGSYQIDSYGTAGVGPGKRHVVEKVSIQPFDFPIGVFAQTINAAGQNSIHQELVFSTGCVIRRDHMNFPNNDTTLDPYYKLPPAVYSSGVITTGNDNASCSTRADSIHKTSACATLSNDSAANGYLAFDRDEYGGTIDSTMSCYSRSTAYGQPWTNSQMDMSTLKQYIDVTARPLGLTAAEYAALRSKAQQQGNYWTSSTISSYTPPCAASPCSNGRTPYPNAVVYFDMSGGASVDTQVNQITGYEQSQCGTRSVIIIVRNGDVGLQSVNLTGALFVPEGSVKLNSSTTFEGTMFAKDIIKSNGGAGANIYLDSCWIHNAPGGLMSARVTNYHEDDRH